jgi:DNA processing protein
VSAFAACDSCLRRSALIGMLAPWIARVLDERRSVPALLSLPDEELVAAVCGEKRSRIDEQRRAFDPAAARRAAASAELTAVCRHGPAFPARLGEGADGPALLYMRGDPGLLALVSESPAVAVVGSRRASAYGLEIARSLGRDLAACGTPVVSGMALGVDSAAHEGALASGGPTIAVLAGGVDVPYPRSKLHLYRRLAEAGLIVSELPPGTRPFRWCFPARNRIMAGLAAMTVVVEGSDRSGSLITARLAADLGRDVGAVPGQVTSGLARGPNALLAAGACVVRSASDVLDALYGAGQKPAISPLAQPLEPRLAELLEAVEAGRSSADALAGGPDRVADVLAGLTELELLGLVGRDAGGRYFRRA